MVKDRDKEQIRISLLALPENEQGERHKELYFWYDGNPFGLDTEKDAVVAIDGRVYQTQAVADLALEAARSMYETSPAIGYLIAKQNFLVVETPAPDWNRISYGVLAHFANQNSVVRQVRDKKNKIA